MAAAVLADVPRTPGTPGTINSLMSRPSAASLQFEDNFWSSGDADAADGTPVYDYRTGLNVMYEKMQQGCVECDEILQFLRQRVSIEELYSSKLSELSTLKMNAKGFDRDDGASLRRTFESVKTESEQLGRCHQQLGNNISEMVLHPLSRFTEDHRKRVRGGMEELDQTIKQFEKQYFVEQYRTGPFCPRPVLYENFYHSPATDQIFGVPIEEQARVAQSKVPPFVAKCLSMVDKQMDMIPAEVRQQMWISPLQLPVIHGLRYSVNNGAWLEK
ncbi:hypothetical protein THASP1DRAFT_27280 [Thamnocephalis sphaerospora]|uniref:F-BAR domain-containing protein n=1 Tax=Thamnocephalis sphaerospora TaxID=78915 RepID=A0A4P9XX78_9FUNG|nr:hypothetical protein THASP1DRAFT_27280 [Thamnocephalis sphaerospora]|eukprot:RKP10914.1 hypothetical protein THASP1DRAFT_27280 [Thamnocephalis sphaerospora]